MIKTESQRAGQYHLQTKTQRKAIIQEKITENFPVYKKKINVMSEEDPNL